MLYVFVFLILQNTQYGAAMEQKHRPDWQAKHTKFDAAIIYDMGRKPHGRLAIGDEVINITDKDQIKTRTRGAHPQVSAREVQLERENVSLRMDNKRLRLLERAVQVYTLCLTMLVHK
jgi:hypothetical protein